MKGQFTRLIVFLTVMVLLVAGITAVTYAVWSTSEGGSTPATTETGEWEDGSFRYLVIEIGYDGGNKLIKYRQKADDGSDFSAFDAGDTAASGITSVKVAGYDGILTTLKIPQEITVRGGGETAVISVDTIAMLSVEEYDGQRLIEELTIPASVTTIEAGSFMFCDNLKSVVFEAGDQPITLGDKCFYRCVSLDRSKVDFGGREVVEGEYCFG